MVVLCQLSYKGKTSSTRTHGQTPSRGRADVNVANHLFFVNNILQHFTNTMVDESERKDTTVDKPTLFIYYCDRYDNISVA